MKVADYFAGFSVKIDKGSFAKADKELAKLESRLSGLGDGSKGFRLSKFFVRQEKLDSALLKGLEIASAKLTFNISKFDVHQGAMNLALGTALDIASTRNTFQISRFHIDQGHLNAALITAMREAALVASRAATLRPNVRTNPVGGINEGGVRARHAAAAGGIAGGLSRVYAPALALGLGGYGLSELNQRNQQVVSAQLQSQAVVQQAGGTAEQGQASFQYLRKEADRIGFNYLEASGDYNKLISGLTGSGVSVGESQKVFSGFAELARVNKLDKSTQNRLFRALSQVAGKGKLQAEELTGQIAEALPGGTALFAQAYQDQLKATGKGKGDLTGQAAIQALLAGTKKGIVSSDILTYAGAAASQRANAGGAFDSAKTASQAEQQRYQNAVSDLAVVASDAGVEEGFARIFRTLNAGLGESDSLVKRLAEGFNDATKFADDLLLFPQSFTRALEGKDSLVADFLGVDKTQQLIKDWNQIKTIWDQLTSGPTPSWLPTLEATSKELAAVLRQGAEFAQFLKTLRDAPKNGAPEASFATQPITATYQGLGRFFGGVGDGLEAAKTRGRAVYEDVNSPYYQNPEKYDADLKAGTNPNANLSNLQFDGIDSELQFKKDAENARLEKYLPELISSPSYNPGSLFLRQPVQNVFSGFESPPELTPSGQPFQDLSRYNPQTPEEIADYNKTLAMSQADTAAAQQTITNNFDISLTVDATLAGETVEQQARAMGEAASNAVTGALEQVQAQYPTR